MAAVERTIMNLNYDTAKEHTDRLVEKLTWRVFGLKTELDARALKDAMGQLALTIEAERAAACLVPTNSIKSIPTHSIA